MRLLKHDEFLARLEKEAQLQATLRQTEVLPPQIGVLARFVARYPWQTIIAFSGLTAVVLELVR